MNKLAFIIFVGLSLTCFSEALNPAGKKLSDGVNKIVARVNDDVITLRDLQEFSKSTLVDKNIKMGDKQILENLIEEKLIVQLAKKEKFKVDNDWVNKKMDKLISAYGGHIKLEDSLAKAGLNASIIRNKIRDSFLIHQAVSKYVGSKVNISPTEITDYYNRHIKEFGSMPKYICWITKSGKESFLIRLSEKIKEKGFDKVLAEKKDVFFKVESDENGLMDKVRKVVNGLKEGEWKIKKIDESYYMIYLAKIIPGHTAFLNGVRDRIYRNLWKKKFSESFESWINGLKEKSVVEVYPAK